MSLSASILKPRTTLAGDPLASFVTNLLHFNDVNGSTTFTDEAGPTWTRTGTSNRISTAVSKFGGSSLESDGYNAEGARIQSSNSIALAGQDFCLEAFFYIASAYNNSYANRFIVGLKGANLDYKCQILQYTNANPGGIFSSRYASVGSLGIGSVVTLPAKTRFYHLAHFRNGNTLYFTVDGVVQGTKDVTGVVVSGTQPLCVGANTDGSMFQAQGYIDEVRMTVGHSRYTGAFTPPTAAFPNP